MFINSKFEVLSKDKKKLSDNEIEFNDDSECHEFEVFQLREH